MTPDPEPGNPDPKPVPRTPFVVDISHWQTEITADVVRQWVAAGVTDVIVKLGGANGTSIYESDTHRAQVSAIRAAGIRAHRYWFNGRAGSIASQVLRILSMLALTPLADNEMLMWDVEQENDTGTARWSPAEVEEAARTLAAHGIPFSRQPVYLSSSVTRSADWSRVVGLGMPLMVADYGVNTGHPSSVPLVGHWPRDLVWIWQYTSTGRLPGYNGDLDLSTGDLHDLWTVHDLQEALNRTGAGLFVDGDMGPNTTSAVIAFQEVHGLKTDGIPGPVTLAKLAEVAG